MRPGTFLFSDKHDMSREMRRQLYFQPFVLISPEKLSVAVERLISRSGFTGDDSGPLKYA